MRSVSLCLELRLYVSRVNAGDLGDQVESSTGYKQRYPLAKTQLLHRPEDGEKRNAYNQSLQEYVHLSFVRILRRRLEEGQQSRLGVRAVKRQTTLGQDVLELLLRLGLQTVRVQRRGSIHRGYIRCRLVH